MSAIARPRSWRRILVHCIIASAGLGLGLVSWYIATPMATRIHETAPGERLMVMATPDIDISLDGDSIVTVSNTQPPRIELLRGSAYFDVRGNEPGKLQIKVGTAYITDIGTRFSVSVQANGGTVAVENGKIEIQVGAGKYLIGAYERADFNNTNVTAQRVIAEADIAPWRSGR